MAEFKESGNNFYRDGNYESAIVEYTKAVDALQAVVAASAASAASDSKGGDTDANTTILATVLSNRAQCYLKTDKFTAAAADCTACLVLDASTATNVKALYRRAVALEKLGQAKAALRDYGEVVRLDPSQAKGVNKARRRVTKAIRAAFAGGAEAGSGGRASSSRAVGVQPPKGGAMINGLTYEEANELRALKQRLMGAQREQQKAENEVKRLNIVGRQLSEPGLGNVFTGVGKMYVRQTVDEAKASITDQTKAAVTRVESTQKAVAALGERMQKLVAEFKQLEQQRRRA